MALKIISQYEYNYKDQYGTPVSDEILTIPDEDYTIQELMQRAVARTMPDLDNGGYYDEIDDDIDFNMVFYWGYLLTQTEKIVYENAKRNNIPIQIYISIIPLHFYFNLIIAYY